jgi:hypothetical protein
MAAAASVQLLQIVPIERIGLVERGAGQEERCREIELAQDRCGELEVAFEIVIERQGDWKALVAPAAAEHIPKPIDRDDLIPSAQMPQLPP